MTEYKNCMNGSNAAGAQAAEDIIDANLDFADAQQAYKDQIAAINEQKTLAQQELVDAQTESDHAMAAIKVQAQNALAAATADYQNQMDGVDMKASSATKILRT